MNILLIFLKKEFLQLARDKRLLPLIFIAPVIQLLILGYAATFDVKKIPLLVVDYDKSQDSRELMQSFLNSGYFVNKAYEDDIRKVDDYFERGYIRVALIIPIGFAKSIHAGRDINIQIIYDGADIITTSIAIGYANLIVNSFSANTQVEFKDIRKLAIKPELRIWYNQELKTAYFMVPAIFALLLTIITVAIGSMSIVKEKELGTIEQLVVTPISGYHIIAGKMSPFIFITMIEVAVVSFVANKLFNVPLRGAIVDLFIASLIFLLSSLGIGLLISILVSTQQQAMMAAIFLYFLPSILLSGFVFPIENMPKWVQPISYILPVTYFIEILRGIFLKGATISDLQSNYIALVIIGIIIFSISTLKFKKSIS